MWQQLSARSCQTLLLRPLSQPQQQAVARKDNSSTIRALRVCCRNGLRRRLTSCCEGCKQLRLGPRDSRHMFRGCNYWSVCSSCSSQLFSMAAENVTNQQLHHTGHCWQTCAQQLIAATWNTTGPTIGHLKTNTWKPNATLQSTRLTCPENRTLPAPPPPVQQRTKSNVTQQKTSHSPSKHLLLKPLLGHYTV